MDAEQLEALARALVHKPRFVVADEPTGNLDSMTGRNISNLLRGVAQQQIGLLVATYDTTVVEAANRVLRIQDGLIEEGASCTLSPPACRQRWRRHQSPPSHTAAGRLRLLDSLVRALKTLRRQVPSIYTGGSVHGKQSPEAQGGEMSGHHDQMSRQSGLPLIWRQRLAVGEGLVLGLLGSILLGHFDWSGYLFVLLTPLLLGVLGRLAVVTRQKRPERGGLGIGVQSWFGVWLGVLGWESFQPQTITDCLHVDAPCGPTTVPFWGDWVGLELFIFFLVLGVGLVLVMVSWFITSIVLHFACRSATKPESSRNHA